jgi:hypothetical protein
VALALGDLHDEDAEGEDLHPPADVGHGETGDQQSEITGTQSVEQRDLLCGSILASPRARLSDLSHYKN